MSGQISKYGWTGLDWSFGDNNELHDTFYVADNTEAEAVLAKIFGDKPGAGNVYQPLQHYRFSSYCAYSCEITPIHEKSVQATDDGQGNWSDAISYGPNIVGGLKFHITFIPLISSGNYTNVAEQSADFSAQIMSVISNAAAQKDDTCLHWSDGSSCTNLRGIMKVVPKLEFMQKRCFCASMPSDTQLGLIGNVNSVPFTMLDQDSTSQITWDPGTVLLAAIPTLRRVRYDGTLMWDITMKFSAITLKDKIEDGSISNVTWQRLYHVGKSYWDKVTWPDGSPIYPSNDLNQLV